MWCLPWCPLPSFLTISTTYDFTNIRLKKYPDIPDIRIFSVSTYFNSSFAIKNIRMALGYPDEDIRIRLCGGFTWGAAAAPGLWLRRIQGELLVWVLPG
jgi:hypothetical protein